MYAAVGERLVVRSGHLDGPVRDAEIIEVHGADGAPPFVVRWSDTGHESLVFPGPDAYVEHVRRDRTLAEPSSQGPARGDHDAADALRLQAVGVRPSPARTRTSE